MINNRQQSGRRRGRGGQRQNNNGGGSGRQDNGNRIDNRARGNAAQLLEKYKTLARDAQQAGDRVLTEVYLQYADHYFRVLSETRARYEENNPQARRQQGDYPEGANSFEGEDGDEGDDGDEIDEFRAPQQRQQARPRDDRPQQREDRPQHRDDRPQQRDDRPRYGEDRQSRDDRPQQRDDRPPQRDDRPRDDRPRRDYAEPRAAQAAPPRNRDEGDTRPRRPLRANGNGNGAGNDYQDDARLDMSVLPPAIAPVERAPEPVAEDEAPAPKRRGRPRKIVEAVEGAAE